VRLAHGIARIVYVLVAFVVAMRMLVRLGRMEMPMLVLFGHMKPDADSH
jgi:hypothetical protein